MNLKLTIHQLVHLHYYCHVRLNHQVLALDSTENRYSYSKWTPGSPCKYFMLPELPSSSDQTLGSMYFQLELLQR